MKSRTAPHFCRKSNILPSGATSFIADFRMRSRWMRKSRRSAAGTVWHCWGEELRRVAEQTASSLIECLPRDLPDKVTVDVSAFNIGDAIHVHDIKLPEGVVTAADLTAFSVVAPLAEEEWSTWCRLRLQLVRKSLLPRRKKAKPPRLREEGAATPAAKGGAAAPAPKKRKSRRSRWIEGPGTDVKCGAAARLSSRSGRSTKLMPNSNEYLSTSDWSLVWQSRS